VFPGLPAGALRGFRQPDARQELAEARILPNRVDAAMEADRGQADFEPKPRPDLTGNQLERWVRDVDGLRRVA
jgi:hypothetical protein